MQLYNNLVYTMFNKREFKLMTEFNLFKFILQMRLYNMNVV